jgi:hypothetical protein
MILWLSPEQKGRGVLRSTRVDEGKIRDAQQSLFLCWIIESSKPQPEKEQEDPEESRGVGEYIEPNSTGKELEEYSDKSSCVEGDSDRFFWYEDTRFLTQAVEQMQPDSARGSFATKRMERRYT